MSANELIEDLLSQFTKGNESLKEKWLNELRENDINNIQALKRRRHSDSWKELCANVSEGLRKELTDWNKSCRNVEWPYTKDGLTISGVDLRHPESILWRDLLVDEIHLFYESGQRQVLFYAPHAIGKTALAQLFSSSLSGVHVVNISCASFSRSDPFDVLKIHGLDLLERVASFKSETLFVLDDCHVWFGNDDFWNAILKVTFEWCPIFVRFLFIATSKSNPPPLYFSSMPQLNRDDFILSEEESYQYADIIGANLIGTNFRNVIVEECAGNIGLMSLSMGFLRFDLRFEVDLEEEDYLRHFYSQKFAFWIARCFPFDLTKPISIPATKALSTMFDKSGTIKIDDIDVLENEVFEKLEDFGIILKTNGFFSFSSRLAKRYLYSIILPSR
jgi:hypothetical protein